MSATLKTFCVPANCLKQVVKLLMFLKGDFFHRKANEMGYF